MKLEHRNLNSLPKSVCFSKLKFIVISKMGQSMKMFFLKGIKKTNVCLDINWSLANKSSYDLKQAWTFNTIFSEEKSLVTAYMLRLKFGKQKNKSKT